MDYVIQTVVGQQELMIFRVPADAPDPDRYAVDFAKEWAAANDWPQNEIVVQPR